VSLLLYFLASALVEVSLIEEELKCWLHPSSELPLSLSSVTSSLDSSPLRLGIRCSASLVGLGRDAYVHSTHSGKDLVNVKDSGCSASSLLRFRIDNSRLMAWLA
jgi:hypothetical protein